jgi:hypothetical protein
MSRPSADHPTALSRVLKAELLRLRPEAPFIDPALDEARRIEQVRLQVASLARPLAALCLSGGGVRSAAFALGIIQGLARPNVRISPKATELPRGSEMNAFGRVEDGRGNLGHSATPRFPSPLIEPDVPISGIRLSDWFHR